MKMEAEVGLIHLQAVEQAEGQQPPEAGGEACTDSSLEPPGGTSLVSDSTVQRDVQWERKSVLFEVTPFVVLHYGSPGKLTGNLAHST